MVSGGQIHAWSLPRYPTDKLFPFSLAMVISAEIALDLTAGKYLEIFEQITVLTFSVMVIA